jgi:branched-chain amino acid transport system ATP-binding protein
VGPWGLRFEMGQAILKVQRLEKSFGGIKAVDAISFDVYEGDTVGIIGPNGAGKTTVFNLITGFYKPDGGSVAFLGRDVTGLDPHRFPHLGVARTFQNLRLFGRLTVFENVLSAVLNRRGYGFLSAVFRSQDYFITEAKAEEKAKALLDFFYLSGKEDYPSGSLPYGDQRKLELARALAMEPKLLLVDEPGAGMNPREIHNFVETLRKVKSRFGLTIMLIEHQMGLVMNVSNRVMVLDFGEKIMEGTPDVVRRDRRVIEAYLGEEAP